MQRLKYFIPAFVVLFLIAALVSAAPSVIYQRTILPETTSTYDLGSPSAVWEDGYIENLNVTTCTGCGGGGSVGTSTTPTIGHLPFWTTSGATPELLGSVATTTLTASSPLSLSNPVAKVGGSNSVLTLDTSGTWTGNAGTATALAANGANCSSGSFPLGVNASGAAETCTDAWTEAENTAAGYATRSSFSATFPITYNSGTGAFSWSGLSTSSPLAAASGLLYATGVNTVASIATSSAIQMSITGNAGTATALAANGTNCTAGNYARGVDASGNAEDCTADANTTYTAGDHLTLTGTDFDVDDDFLLNTGDTGTGTYTLANTIVTNGTTTNATSTNLNVSGQVDFDALTSALVLTGATGILAEYAGTSCTNQFVRSLSALGVATCATVANTDLANSTISGVALGSNLANLTATDSTLTFSGTYNGSTARTIGLNLGNANSWTALQQFANASSTLFSTSYASSTVWRGGGLTTDCDTAGTSKLLWDTTTGQFSCGTDQDTTYTAGDALTLTATDIDFDGGPTPQGDLGGTWAAPTVDGVTCTDCLTTTEIADSYVLNTSDTMSGSLTVGTTFTVTNGLTTLNRDAAAQALTVNNDTLNGDGILISIGASDPPGTGEVWINFGDSDNTSQGSIRGRAIANSITLDAAGDLYLEDSGDLIFVTVGAATTDRSTLCIDASEIVTSDAAGNDCDTSSRKFKTDITYPELNGLDLVMQMKPADFTRIRTNLRERGLIAEDVALIDPLLVWNDDDGEPNSLSEYALIAVLADAIQELAVQKGVAVKRTAEDNWQNFLIGVLFIYVAYNELRKRKGV